MDQKVYKQTSITEIAREVLSQANSKILCLHGEMGTGKTTLIKAMLQVLEAADVGTSPTFGIVNEYHTTDGEVLAYHFDFYRLNDETEALDFGLEEYFNEDTWVFIEWPEKITSFLPADVTNVYLEVIDETRRGLRLD
ncbi:tRNA (adenosine(37)-N6)-threonylcarbamoyltransferase complex ATPase subunit type 1 TsaE [Flavobacteriaceae bacterium TP-CH-4]|uniref:tRNA threonylcarbamoyladenosine biosynthesis protein TsaE n=1 Tax=Pelagihabitans pacificus TaxID=2696054 RepID=A0A967EBA5_9FLAO|nr:tRNA (adenosine(37)-N6)-threonylcarbamoyltransferase complex ATPase subunit type 1 TsaE [Pelagihabitans pacificus]NHF60166.1 tRNA (adenosine(37)-N6)-threonylcarbamoyltransferase complex ATPase subunit type 1 TsaE [Pelagihabitans pacificus]